MTTSTTVPDATPLTIEHSKTLARLASGMIDLRLSSQGYDPHKEIRDRETKLSVYASTGAIFSEAEFFVRVKPVPGRASASQAQSQNPTTSLYGRPAYTVYATSDYELFVPHELAALMQRPRRLADFEVLEY